MRCTTLATALLFLAPADTARSAGTETVAEIVTFRLTADADPDAFIAAASDMTPFLRGTGAVLSRRLSVDDTGLWTDHIIWTSMQAAQEAAAAMMEHPDAGPFMQHIDPDAVTLRHATVRFSMPQE